MTSSLPQATAATAVLPVVLCGGSGTRLWPLSRAGHPKQFLALAGHTTQHSLFQQATLRLAALASCAAPGHSALAMLPPLVVGLSLLILFHLPVNGVKLEDWLRSNLGWSVTYAVPAVILAQFAVAGPVVFAAMLWGYARPVAPGLKALALLSAPPLVIVCVQALLDKAYANWAVAAYFAGTVLAVAVLGARAPRLLPVEVRYS